MPIQNYGLSLVIVSNKDFGNWSGLLPHVHSVLKTLDLSYEILVAAPELNENTRKIIEHNNFRVLSPSAENYGMMLQRAVQQATGDYIITMDADQTQPLDFLLNLWQAREAAEIILCSRYLPGGRAEMPASRRILSRLLNLVFSRGLDLQVRDMSCAFRLYKGVVIKALRLESNDYAILQEILVHALMMGHRIIEIPFIYHSPDPGNTRAIHFG